jgi:hypothetical protein
MPAPPPTQQPAPFAHTKIFDITPSELPEMQGYNYCSMQDFLSCHSQCVDESLPWERVSSVSCRYNYYNRSYFVATCECQFVPNYDPVPKHGPTPPDVGFGGGQ